MKWDDEREEKLLLLEFKVRFLLELEPSFFSAFIYCSGIIMAALKLEKVKNKKNNKID